MAYITFDYYCDGLDCPDNMKVEERFVYSTEIDNQRCSKCQRIMIRDIPAPVGRVKGTENPVKV